MLKSKFIVTCICHGDTCNGHVTKIGVANSSEAAEAIIKDDMRLFADNLMSCTRDPEEIKLSDFDISKPHEIWYDDQNGRVYDVIEV